jgi:hypothetical protein
MHPHCDNAQRQRVAILATAARKQPQRKHRCESPEEAEIDRWDFMLPCTKWRVVSSKE